VKKIQPEIRFIVSHYLPGDITGYRAGRQDGENNSAEPEQKQSVGFLQKLQNNTGFAAFVAKFLTTFAGLTETKNYG
jgi:hypothetical protein